MFEKFISTNDVRCMVVADVDMSDFCSGVESLLQMNEPADWDLIHTALHVYRNKQFRAHFKLSLISFKKDSISFYNIADGIVEAGRISDGDEACDKNWKVMMEDAQYATHRNKAEAILLHRVMSGGANTFAISGVKTEGCYLFEEQIPLEEQLNGIINEMVYGADS